MVEEDNRTRAVQQGGREPVHFGTFRQRDFKFVSQRKGKQIPKKKINQQII